MARNNAANPRGIVTALVARFSAIGDVAMTVPVLYSACQCYPDITFVFVTRTTMTSIFVNAPSNLVVEGVDVKDEYKGINGMRRLVGELDRRYHFDVFIDLHDVIRTRLMGLACTLKGKRVCRINKGRGDKKALTRSVNKIMLPLVSQRARYREVFFKAGLPLHEDFNGLFGGRRKASPSLFAAITAPRPEGERWVGIAPFAAHPGKIYPPEQMHEVVCRLAALPHMKIFLLGGGGNEQEVLDGWAAGLDNVQSLAGRRYGFGAELALMNHMDTMLTMDSANMHLAAIAGVPVVSVWGATHPYCGFKAWRQRDTDTVQLPLTCRPCSVFGNRPCRRGDYLCLTGIRPEAVYKKVLEQLDV